MLYLNITFFCVPFSSKPSTISKTSNVERKVSQQQWSRGNFAEVKVPHVRMDNGAALQVFRKQSEVTGNFQVSSVSMVNGKNDLKVSL